MKQRLRYWYFSLRYLLAEFQYVSYRGPHGYVLNTRAHYWHEKMRGAG